MTEYRDYTHLINDLDALSDNAHLERDDRETAEAAANALRWYRGEEVADGIFIPAHAVEINRLRNVIQSACSGGLGRMIERWKELFPDEPVPSIRCAAEAHGVTVADILAEFDRRAEPGTGFYEPDEPAQIIRNMLSAANVQPKGTAEPFVTSDMLRAALDDLKANHQVVPSMHAMSSALHAALAAAPAESAAATPASQDDVRKAFESEMRCEDEWGHKNLKRDKHGDYLNSWTGSMWAVWKACAANYAEQAARAERNRDMWREQCRGQAAQLEALRSIQAPAPAHHEVERLRGLAATCYAGLGAECNLPETWLDVLNAAANGEPFTTDGLLPFTASQAPAVGAEAGDWRNYWADEMQKKADNDKARGCLQPVGYYVRSAFIYAGVWSKS